MGETEIVEIAEIISSVIQNDKDHEAIGALRNSVETLCKRFPIY
jgi:glycine/serine hydroxymethyltransferase